MFRSAITLLLVFACPALAGSIESSINNRTATDLTDGQAYTFWVAGQIAGPVSDKQAVYPTSSFTANIDLFNASRASLFMLLGDNYQAQDETRVFAFRSVCNKINAPVFNAPGDRDAEDRNLYVTEFGKQTWSDFKVGSDLFIILDTTVANGALGEEQLKYFKTTIKDCAVDDTVRNVFIFSHHLTWASDVDGLQHMAPNSGHTDYTNQIRPFLNVLGKFKQVIWFSGDINHDAQHTPDSKLYWKDPNINLHCVATAMFNTDKDAVVHVNVDPTGNVSMTPIRLASGLLDTFAQTDPAQWQPKAAPIPNDRAALAGVPVQAGSGLKTFLAGCMFGLAIGAALFIELRRRPTGPSAPQPVVVTEQPITTPDVDGELISDEADRQLRQAA